MTFLQFGPTTLFDDILCMNYNAFFPGKLLTWLMLTNQEAWIGENIFCFMIGYGGWDGMDGSPGG